jgi:transcriptional regulator with XRE-family HTH domain
MTHKGGFRAVNEPEVALGPRTQRGKEASERLHGRVAIAKAIIEARLRKGWTQLQLAETAGTKQSRISELESIKGNPTLETIERVARVLDLELSLKPARAVEPQVYVSSKVNHTTFILGSFGPSHRIDREAERFVEVPIPAAIAARMRVPATRPRVA